jgi:hypothetical protein
MTYTITEYLPNPGGFPFKLTVTLVSSRPLTAADDKPCISFYDTLRLAFIDMVEAGTGVALQRPHVFSTDASPIREDQIATILTLRMEIRDLLTRLGRHERIDEYDPSTIERSQWAEAAIGLLARWRDELDAEYSTYQQRLSA